MNAVQRFFRHSWLAYRGLFLWLTPWSFVSSVVLAPLLNFLLLAYVGRGVSEAAYRDLLLNLPLYSASPVVLGGVLQMFYHERGFGIVIVAPRSSLYSFWSKGTFHFPNGILAIAVTMIATFYLADISIDTVSWPWLILAVCLSSMSYVSFSLLLGVAVNVTENWLTTLVIGNAAILLLTGIVIPRSELPAAVRYLTEILPIVNALKTYQSAMEGTTGIAMMWNLTTEAIVALLLGALASALFLFVENLRRHSKLPL